MFSKKFFNQYNFDISIGTINLYLPSFNVLLLRHISIGIAIVQWRYIESQLYSCGVSISAKRLFFVFKI